MAEYNKKFDVDLKYGQEAENLIRRMGRDGDVKVEVKRDDKRTDTNNIFVETSWKGKDSGIITTESDYWFHFWRPNKDGGPGWFFGAPTDELRTMTDYAVTHNKLISGGDGLNAQGAIIPFDWVLWGGNLK